MRDLEAARRAVAGFKVHSDRAANLLVVQTPGVWRSNDMTPRAEESQRVLDAVVAAMRAGR